MLGENEVFCQYQESDETAPVVVQAECLVCRAPARTFQLNSRCQGELTVVHPGQLDSVLAWS